MENCVAEKEVKKCSCCGHVWSSLPEFLSDPDVVLIGYQANFRPPEVGYLLFNHVAAQCNTTLGLVSDHFIDLCVEPVFSEPPRRSCGYTADCLHPNDLEPCPALCECTYIKKLIQTIHAYPRKRDIEVVNLKTASEEPDVLFDSLGKDTKILGRARGSWKH